MSIFYKYDYDHRVKLQQLEQLQSELHKLWQPTGDWLLNVDKQGQVQAAIREIESDLLEYRRQHNIFEVGDKAVYLSNIAPEHDDIYELSKIGKMHHLLKIGAMDYNAKFNHIRHATDEEIKNNQREN